MKKYFFILTLFIVFYSYGQQSKIDSLKKELSKNLDTKTQLIILDSLTTYYFINSTQNDEELLYYNKLNKVSIENKNYSLESKSYRLFSEYYLKKADSLKSKEYALKSLKTSIANNNNEDYYLSINQLGRVYHDFQKYEEAIETFKLGLKKYESGKSKIPTKIIVRLYINLYTSYSMVNENAKSIEYLEKGYDIALKMNDKEILNNILYYLSFSYLEIKQFEKSEKKFTQTLDFAIKNDDERIIGACYHGMGLLYSRWNKFELALKYNMKALEYFRKIGNKLYEFDTLNNIAVLFANKEDYMNAELYANKSLKIAEEIKNKFAINGAKSTMAMIYQKTNREEKSKSLFFDILKDTIESSFLSIKRKSEIYYNLSEIYEKERDYKNSLIYYRKSRVLEDSITKTSKSKEFSDIENKYETQKKENENLQLKQENTQKELALLKQTRNNWFLGVGLSLSLLGIGAYSYFYLKTKRQKELIENLQVELHHTVKNNLSFISTFIDLTIDDVEEDKIQNKLIELKQRIESINEVHKELYAMKGETQVKMKKYIQRISSLVNDSYSNKKVVFGQNIDESIVLSPNNSFPIGLIINEFLTNSYKYAFKNITNPTINIDFSHHVNQYILKLSDNGVGLNNIDIENESFGLNLMRNLSKQLGGSYNIDGQNGVTILIKFPVKH